MEMISAKIKSTMSKSTKVQDDNRARYGHKLPTNRAEPQFFQDFPTPNETGRNTLRPRKPVQEHIIPNNKPQIKQIQSYSSMTKNGKIIHNIKTQAEEFPTLKDSLHTLHPRHSMLNRISIDQPQTKQAQSYSSMTKYGKITHNLGNQIEELPNLKQLPSTLRQRKPSTSRIVDEPTIRPLSAPEHIMPHQPQKEYTQTQTSMTEQSPLTQHVVTETDQIRMQAPMKHHRTQCKYNHGQNLYYPHAKIINKYIMPPITAGQQHMEEIKWECNLNQPNNACREGFGSQFQEKSNILEGNTIEECDCLSFPKEKVTYSPENGYKYIHKKGIKAFIKKDYKCSQENVHELLNPPAQAQYDNKRIEQIWIHRGKELTLKEIKQNCPNGYRIIAQFMPQTETGITFKIMKEDTPLTKEMLQLEDEVPKCEWDAEYFKNLIIHVMDYDTLDLYSWTYDLGVIAFFHKAAISLKKDDMWITESVEELLNRNHIKNDNKYKEEVWIHKGAHLDIEDIKKICKNGCRIITQYMPDAKYSLVHKIVKEDTPLSLEMLRLRDEIPKTEWEKENYKTLKITVIDHDHRCQYSWSEETGGIMVWDLHAHEFEIESQNTHSNTTNKNKYHMVTQTDIHPEFINVELNTLTLDPPNTASNRMTSSTGHTEPSNVFNPPIGGTKRKIPTNLYNQWEYQRKSEERSQTQRQSIEDLITELPTPKEIDKMIPNNSTTRGKLGQMKVLYQVLYQTRGTQIMAYDKFKHTNAATQMIQAIREINNELTDLANNIMNILEKQKLDEDEEYLDLPPFGDEHRVDMREVEGLPKFNPENQKITLYQFWKKLSQFVKAKKMSEEATKSILSQTLLGIAFDIFDRNHDKSVKDIITQLRNRFGTFPTKASLLDQLSTFSRDSNEPIRSAMNRFEYLLHNIYKRDPHINQIVEGDCKQKVRDLAHPEAKIQLDRKEAIATAQGQTLSYNDRLNIIHMEEKLLRANGKLTQPSIQNINVQEEEALGRTYHQDNQPYEEYHQAQWTADIDDEQSYTEESEAESQDEDYPLSNQIQHVPYKIIKDENFQYYNEEPEVESQNEYFSQMQHQSFEEMVNHHQNDNSQETEVQNGYNAFSNQLQHYPETHFYQAQPEQVYREYHPDQYHQTNYIEQFQAQEPSSTPFRNTLQPHILVSITMPDNQPSPAPQFEEITEQNHDADNIEYQQDHSNSIQDHQDAYTQMNSSQVQIDHHPERGNHQQFEAARSETIIDKPITAQQFLNGEEGTAIKLPNYDQINNISISNVNKVIEEQKAPEEREEITDPLAQLIEKVGDFVNKMNPEQDNFDIIHKITDMLLHTLKGKK